MAVLFGNPQGIDELRITDCELLSFFEQIGTNYEVIDDSVCFYCFDNFLSYFIQINLFSNPKVRIVCFILK